MKSLQGKEREAEKQERKRNYSYPLHLLHLEKLRSGSGYVPAIMSGGPA